MLAFTRSDAMKLLDTDCDLSRAELGKRTGLPVRYVDERYTTSASLRAIREMGGSTRGRKGDVDAMAATILLRHALDLPE